MTSRLPAYRSTHLFFTTFLFTYTCPRHLPSFPTRRSSDLPTPCARSCSSSRCASASRTRSSASHPSACPTSSARSEEHTSELQSLRQIVCRPLLEKKNESRTIYKQSISKVNMV